ncbi:PAS domain S-box protein [Natrialbaceae archaeon A-arb3/5]
MTRADHTSDSVTVLHVDDDASFADLTATFLEREADRIDVLTATSANRGGELLDERHVDCVVSDYDMPETDGLAFLSTVRDAYGDLPFILFTGKGSEEIAAEAISEGVTDYLQKETGSDQYAVLANRVLNAVETRRAQTHQKRQLDAIQTAREGISILNDEGQFIFVNDAYADIYGYEPEEMLGEHWSVTYPDGDTEFSRNTILPAVDETGYWHGETTGIKADGTTFVEDHVVASTGEDELVCTVRDVTDTKARKNEIEQLTQFRQAIIDSANVWINVLDEDGNVTVWNNAAEETSGYDTQEVVGHDEIWEWLYPDEEYRREILDHVSSILQGEKAVEEFETTIRTKSGEQRVISWYSQALVNEAGSLNGSVAVGRDVTTEQRAEQRYETLIENLPGIVYRAEVDRSWPMETVHGTARELTEYTTDELRDDVSWGDDVVHPEDRDRIYETVREAVAADDSFELTYRIRTRSGDRRWVWEQGRPVNGDQVEGFITDVTDRKRTENKFEAIVEHSPVLTAVLDRDGTFVYANAAHEELLGYRPSELLDSTIVEYVHPDDREHVQTTFDELLTDPSSLQTFEFRVTDTTGGWRWLRSRGRNCLTEIGVEGIVVISQDVTERKTREQDLNRQNQRLEEFASVVSHDLRNPLNVASGRLELAREQDESDHLELIADSLARMERIIDDMLWLTREGREIGSRSTVSIYDLSAQAWKHVATGEATLDRDVPDDWEVIADETRLLQLFENLVRNAVEHGGPTVTVRVGTLPDRAGFYIEDDGTGIPTAKRNRVFDAGYSTAEGGTGFGLRIVEEIVDAHGWDASVTDSTDGGTRIEIDVDPNAT